jgi:hypothetical protein
MKCSKQFATEHGQSHLPSNMIHVLPTTRNVTTPEGTPIVMLELQRAGKTNTYLRLRMTVPEAYGLIESLKISVANGQATLPEQPVAATRGFYVDPKEWEMAPDPTYAENPPDDWEECEQCGGAHLPLGHQPLAF